MLHRLGSQASAAVRTCGTHHASRSTCIDSGLRRIGCSGQVVLSRLSEATCSLQAIRGEQKLKWRQVTCKAKRGSEREVIRIIDPHANSPVHSNTQQSRLSTSPPFWLLPIIFFGLTTLISAIILQKRQRKPAVKESFGDAAAPSAVIDARNYQRALAHTRQSAHVRKAAGFLQAAEPARALVQLNLALEENSICRSPLLDGQLSRAELGELYCLYIKSSAVPVQYASLLQLQEMLGLSSFEADALELEVMQTPGVFSI